jgi:hypothetical protein
MRFSFEDTVQIQKQRREKAMAEGLTVSQAYDLAVAEVEAAVGQRVQTNGYAVGPDAILRPIPGAITSYENGRPVIARPLDSEPEPKRKKIRPVSIESLCEVDGRVDLADTHDEVEELLPPQPVRVAGEDFEQDEIAVDTSVEDSDEDGDDDAAI